MGTTSICTSVCYLLHRPYEYDFHTVLCLNVLALVRSAGQHLRWRHVAPPWPKVAPPWQKWRHLKPGEILTNLAFWIFKIGPTAPKLEIMLTGKLAKIKYIQERLVIEFWNFRYDFWGVGGDVWRRLCRHACRKISASVDGRLSGVSRVCGHGSEDPNWR